MTLKLVRMASKSFRMGMGMGIVSYGISEPFTSNCSVFRIVCMI